NSNPSTPGNGRVGSRECTACLKSAGSAYVATFKQRDNARRRAFHAIGPCLAFFRERASDGSGNSPRHGIEIRHAQRLDLQAMERNHVGKSACSADIRT
ncbi:hypothetical protein, partial [Rhizobium leguminosarum]|uniref:hypothetical protein n=1 Tax=Rhizobium leguminosarum TaxID=384 RepID=UPI00197DFB3F